MNSVKQTGLGGLMASQQLIDTLKGLGVNALEAEVYCALLRNDGVTAYRLAKLLNKATANVYKSVKVLASLGGIIIQQSSKELCYAVKPELFLESLDIAFQERRARASELLTQDQYDTTEKGIYQIDNARLAIQHAKNAIDSAQQSIIIDLFPKIMEMLRENIELAIKRGVQVSVQCYDNATIEGANLVKTFRADKVMKLWKTEQLNLVVDGKESLICLFNDELSEVSQAMWSKDLYLACVLHVGLSREHFFHQLKHYADKNPLPQKLDELINHQNSLILNTILEQTELESLLQSTAPQISEIDDLFFSRK